MDAKLLNELLEWEMAGDRKVEIEIQNKGKTSIWCYDRKLSSGQFIEKSIDELNLVDKAIEYAKDRLKQLEAIKEAM